MPHRPGFPSETKLAAETAPAPIRRLADLLNGWTDDDTPESSAEEGRIHAANRRTTKEHRRTVPTGFAEGSETWQACRALGCPIVAHEEPPRGGTADLFEAPIRRWTIDEDLWLDMFPRVFDDAPPPPDLPDPAVLEPGSVLAWDREHVLVICPRGICLFERSRWNDGWRHCPGC